MFPEIRIDVEALGAKVTLPPDFKDTSRSPPDKSAPPVGRAIAPGADDPAIQITSSWRRSGAACTTSSNASANPGTTKANA